MSIYLAWVLLSAPTATPHLQQRFDKIDECLKVAGHADHEQKDWLDSNYLSAGKRKAFFCIRPVYPQ